MQNYHIRPFQSSDLPAVYAIEQQQSIPWSKRVLEDCLQTGYSNWVITQQNEIIGFAIVKILIDECELLNIAIKTSQQRQGYGQILLQHIIKQAQEKKWHKLFLEVRISNVSAIALYQKMGFTKISVRKDYYPLPAGREDAIVMSHMCR